jgi:hypothetical protein
VCTAFHGPPPIPEYQAAHLDGKPANCAASNLAWKTHKENMADMLRHGTVPRGERNGYSKLTEADVRLMRAEWRGRSLAATAAEFGVSRPAVCMILSGKRWGWLK